VHAERPTYLLLTTFVFVLVPTLTDNFWDTQAACNETLLKMEWDTKKSIMTDGDVDKVDDFLLSNINDCSFFMSVLLLRSNEVGVLYSPRTNFRLASKEKMLAMNNLSKSMYDCAMSTDNEREFDSSRLALTFYQISKVGEFCIDTPRLTSVSKEVIILEDQRLFNTEIHIAQASATKVSKEEFMKLCFILNVKPKQVSEEFAEQGIFDFDAVLSAGRNTDILNIRNNDSLAQFLRNKLDWPFFKVQQEMTFAHNMWRVRSFLQTITPIGISMLEGSHRMTLAAKLLTGMNITRSIPYMPYAKNPNPVIVPERSPLFAKITVQVFAPVDTVNPTTRHHFITTESLINCRKWSQHVADMRTHFIESTWRDWMEDIITEIATDIAFDHHYEVDDFIRFDHYRKGRKTDVDRYMANLGSVIKIVSTSLWDKLPAKRLAEVAKKKALNEYGQPAKADKQEFLGAMTDGRMLSYVYQFWVGVRIALRTHTTKMTNSDVSDYISQSFSSKYDISTIPNSHERNLRPLLIVTYIENRQ
jgi:hypothetical protein